MGTHVFARWPFVWILLAKRVKATRFVCAWLCTSSFAVLRCCCSLLRSNCQLNWSYLCVWFVATLTITRMAEARADASRIYQSILESIHSSIRSLGRSIHVQINHLQVRVNSNPTTNTIINNDLESNDNLSAAVDNPETNNNNSVAPSNHVTSECKTSSMLQWLTNAGGIWLNAKLIHLFHWQAKQIAVRKQLHHGKRTNAADEPEVPFDTPILRDLSAFERWKRNAMYLQVNDYKFFAELQLPLLCNIAFLCPTLQLSSPLLSLLYSPLPWLNSSGSQSIMICAILQPFTPKQSLVKRVSFNWLPSEHT